MKWRTIKEHIPKSAKIMPVWLIFTEDDSRDMVFLTDDEKYFVSIDHKRVYPVNEDIIWSMIDIPI